MNKKVEKARQEAESIKQEAEQARQDLERERMLSQQAREELIRAQAYQEALQPKEEEKNPYDKEFEKESWLEFELEKTNKTLGKIQQGQQTQEQVSQEQIAYQNAFLSAGEELKKSTMPDLGEAYQYVLDRERKKASRKASSPQEIEAMAEQEMLALFLPGLKGRGKIDQDLMDQAKDYGFKPNNSAAPDLEAIAKNKQKSSSTGSGSSASVVEGNMEVSRTLKKTGRGVDPDAFRAMIARQK
jgi:hypothetical protein